LIIVSAIIGIAVIADPDTTVAPRTSWCADLREHGRCALGTTTTGRIGYAARHECNSIRSTTQNVVRDDWLGRLLFRSSELRAGLAIVRMAQLPEALVGRGQALHVATAAFVRHG
jgi:hypothetical protein